MWFRDHETRHLHVLLSIEDSFAWWARSSRWLLMGGAGRGGGEEGVKRTGSRYLPTSTSPRQAPSPPGGWGCSLRWTPRGWFYHSSGCPRANAFHFRWQSDKEIVRSYARALSAMRATVKYVVVIKLECIHILPENITFFFFFLARVLIWIIQLIQCNTGITFVGWTAWKLPVLLLLLLLLLC